MLSVRLSLLLSVLSLLPPTARGVEPLAFRGKTLEQWRADLHSINPGVRCRAAAALGLGPFGNLAVPALLDARKDDDHDVKASALASLAELGPTAPDAAPVLVREITIYDHRQWGRRYYDSGAGFVRPIDVTRIPTASIPLLLARVRQDRLLALGLDSSHFLNGVDRSALPLLRSALRDGSPHIREAGAAALGAMRDDAASAVPELLETLNDGSPAVRAAVLNALRHIRSRHAVVPALAPFLFGAEPAAAARALACQGAEGMAALRRVYHSSADLRVMILQCINNNAAGTDARPLFLDALEDRDSDVREVAATAISCSTIAVDQELPRLLRAMEDGSSGTRARIVGALGEIVPPRRDVILTIARRLTDESPDVRVYAAVALQRQGRHARPALPLLLQAVRHRNPEIRILALELVGQIASPSQEVVLLLCEALKDDSLGVRLNAAEVLGKFGPSVRAYIVSAGSPTSERCSEIVVQGLLACLRDRDMNLRITAANSLLKIGYSSDSLIEQLGQEVLDPWRRALRLPVSGARVAAAATLQGLGAKSAPALPMLTLALYDGDSSAIEPIGAMGPAARLAIPALECFLRTTSDENLQRSLALALLRVGGDGPGILRTVLAEGNESLMVNVLRGTEWAGESAKGLLPDILRLTQHSSSTVRENAICVLKSIRARGEDVLAVLLRALRDEEESVRYAACVTLGALGPEAKPALPALTELLLHRYAGCRRKAVEALGRIGPEDNQAFPALVETLTDPDEEVRKDAVVALDRAGRQAVPALRRACGDSSDSVRVAAASALGRRDGNREVAVRVLRSVMLDGKQCSVRVEASLALWKQERSREVVPVLASLLREEGARSAAVEALGNLDGARDDVHAFMRPLLKHELRGVRMAAWQVLEKTSPELTTALVDAR